MKNKTVSVLIALVFVMVIFLAPPAIQAASSNDNDKAQAALDALKALDAEEYHDTASSYEEHFPGWRKWYTVHGDKITKMAKSFYEAYPKDPRRWEAVLIMLKHPPKYYLSISYGHGMEGKDFAEKQDKAPNDKWHSQAVQLAAKLKAAPDVPDQTQRDFHALLLRDAIYDLPWVQRTRVGRVKSQAFTDDYRSKNSPLLGGLKKFLARWPDYDARELFLKFIVLDDFQKSVEAKKAILKEFQDTPNASVRDYVKAALPRMDKLANLGNITFTAADGREVSLEEMRGKVVFVYVWSVATDKFRIPDYLKAYKRFHDRGEDVEFIGISKDDADAKDKVLAFIKEKSIPWPISYEGKAGSQNPILKAFGLDGTEEGSNVLHILLINQQGKVSFISPISEPMSTIPGVLDPEIRHRIEQRRPKVDWGQMGTESRTGSEE